MSCFTLSLKRKDALTAVIGLEDKLSADVAREDSVSFSLAFSKHLSMTTALTCASLEENYPLWSNDGFVLCDEYGIPLGYRD